MNLGDLSSRPKIKDCDCPAGHEFHVERSRAYDPDCPYCKYGTPVYRPKTKDWQCIDCKRIMNHRPQ